MKEKKPISANLFIEDISYLKKNGINKSAFMRQAVQAHRENKFKYDYLDGKKE